MVPEIILGFPVAPAPAAVAPVVCEVFKKKKIYDNIHVIR
jgi:hypothetical protein